MEEDSLGDPRDPQTGAPIRLLALGCFKKVGPYTIPAIIPILVYGLQYWTISPGDSASTTLPVWYLTFHTLLQFHKFGAYACVCIYIHMWTSPFLEGSHPRHETDGLRISFELGSLMFFGGGLMECIENAARLPRWWAAAKGPKGHMNIRILN